MTCTIDNMNVDFNRILKVLSHHYILSIVYNLDDFNRILKDGCCTTVIDTYHEEMISIEY